MLSMKSKSLFPDQAYLVTDAVDLGPIPGH